MRFFVLNIKRKIYILHMLLKVCFYLYFLRGIEKLLVMLFNKAYKIIRFNFLETI